MAHTHRGECAIRVETPGIEPPCAARANSSWLPARTDGTTRHVCARQFSWDSSGINVNKQMSNYDVFYSHQGTAIVLRGDLGKGWRKLKNRWGFDSALPIPFRHDWSIRAHLRVTAHGELAESVPEFPDFPLESSDQFLTYSLRNRILEITIPLNKDQPWRTMSNGRPGLVVEQRPFLKVDKRLHFSFSALIVFHEPFPAPIPDVKEWGQKMFVSGGQFESNRRRH